MKVLFLLFILLLTIPISHAHAEEISFGIYPPTTHIKANDNNSIQIPVTVINTSELARSFELNFRGFEIIGIDGNIRYYPEKDTDINLKKLIENIQILDNEESISTIFLYPNESKTLIISIPTEKLTPQDYYFAAIASPVLENKNLETTASQINPGIASLIFLTVGTDSTPNISIQNLDTALFNTGSNIAISGLVSNNSESFENLSNKLEIFDMIGRRTDIIKLRDELIPAQSKKIIHTTDGKTHITLPDGFYFGIYTARLTTTTQKGSTFTKETRFVSLPIIFILFTTAALFVILGIVFRVFKKLTLKER